MKKENNSSCSMKTSIGGQALIEGIMMRGPKKSAMAVRNPEGEIVLEKWDNQVTKRPKFFKLPIIRGLFNFIDSMVAGYKCLMRSAEISGLEEIAEEMEKEKKALAKNFNALIEDILDNYEKYSEEEKVQIKELFQKASASSMQSPSASQSRGVLASRHSARGSLLN